MSVEECRKHLKGMEHLSDEEIIDIRNRLDAYVRLCFDFVMKHWREGTLDTLRANLRTATPEKAKV